MSRMRATLYSRMQREVRKIEATAREETGGDPGTGQTIIRMQRHQPPILTLVEAGRIGTDELQAAEQIGQAVTAICGRGTLAAALLERVDFGREDERDWPHTLAIAVRNFQDWQRYWSAEWAHTRNPMCQVVWAAVIDQTPISTIADDIGYGHRRTTRAVVCGIRHYAAFAGLVTGIQRQAWLDAAQHVFARMVPDTTS